MTKQLRFPRQRTTLLVAVALVALGAGAAIAAIATPAGETEKAPSSTENAGWERITTGNDPNFGRYELFRATVDGEECLGLDLVDQNPPAVARAITSHCNLDAALNVAFIRGEAGTLIWGVTSPETESVTLSGAGESERPGRVINAAGRRIVMASNPRRFPRARVRAARRDGSTLAVQEAAE